MLKTSNLQVASSQVVKPSVLKNIRSKIGSLGPMLSCHDTAATPPRTRDVFEPQFFQAAAGGSMTIMGTDFGMVDFRFVLEGTETVFALPRSSLQGDGLKDKQSFLNAMDPVQFLALVNSHGFSAEVKPGSLLVIPSTVVLMFLYKEETHGLRWKTVPNKFRRADCAAFLADLQRSGDPAQMPDHIAFAEWLQEVDS